MEKHEIQHLADTIAGRVIQDADIIQQIEVNSVGLFLRTNTDIIPFTELGGGQYRGMHKWSFIKGPFEFIPIPEDLIALVVKLRDYVRCHPDPERNKDQNELSNRLYLTLGTPMVTFHE